MKLYLKLFLAMALPYGIMMSIFMLNPVIGMLSGALFGGVMALIFGTVQHMSFRGKKAQAERSVQQSRTFELDLMFDDAFNLCLEAYTELHRAVIKKVDRDSGTIEIRTGMNWLTYGELVTVQLRVIAPFTTEVSISSRPRVKTTMIDYGRNLQNVNLLALHLREQIATDNLTRQDVRQIVDTHYTQEQAAMLKSAHYS